MKQDPYIFEFLTAEASTAERILEAELVSHLRQTLLELGRVTASHGGHAAICARCVPLSGTDGAQIEVGL